MKPTKSRRRSIRQVPLDEAQTAVAIFAAVGGNSSKSKGIKRTAKISFDVK